MLAACTRSSIRCVERYVSRAIARRWPAATSDSPTTISSSVSQRLHTVLLELGTGPGDRVAVLAFNSIQFVELYCGISACGRSQVPLNFRWAEPELAYGLADSGARILVTDRDPGGLADLVDRVIRIDTGEYDELVVAATRHRSTKPRCTRTKPPVSSTPVAPREPARASC